MTVKTNPFSKIYQKEVRSATLDTLARSSISQKYSRIALEPVVRRDLGRTRPPEVWSLTLALGWAGIQTDVEDGTGRGLERGGGECQGFGNVPQPK